MRDPGTTLCAGEEEERRMANQMGKRYNCPTCNAEVVVTKGGDGTLRCHDQDMVQK